MLALPSLALGKLCASAASPPAIFAGAKQAAEKIEISCEIYEKCPSVAKDGVDSVGFMRRLKPPPPSALSFSAACEARLRFVGGCGTLRVRSRQAIEVVP